MKKAKAVKQEQKQSPITISHFMNRMHANFFWSWVVFLFSHPTSLLPSSQLKEMHLILILFIFSVFSRLYKMHLSVAGVQHNEQQRNKDTDTQTHKDREREYRLNQRDKQHDILP